METRRVCVRGIITKDNKLFAQKLKRKNGGVTDYWCTPGGGVDSLEALHDALHREMIEETGIAPEIGRLILVQQYSDGKKGNHGEIEQLEFFFEITNADDYETIDLSTTTHGNREIDSCGFIDPKTENIAPRILATTEFSEALHSPTTPVLFHTEL